MDPLGRFWSDCGDVFAREIKARGFTLEDVRDSSNAPDERPLDLQAAIGMALRKMDAFAREQFEERDLAKTLKTNN